MAITTLSHDRFMELLSKAIKRKSTEVTRKDGSRKVFTSYVVDQKETFDNLVDYIASYIESHYQHKDNRSYAVKFLYKLVTLKNKSYDQNNYNDLLDAYINEIALVYDIRNSNQKSFNMLYSKYINKVRVFYNIKTRNVHDGRELAEIAFQAAYFHIDKYNPQYGFYQFVTNYLGKSILNEYWKDGLTTVDNTQFSVPEADDRTAWEDIPVPQDQLSDLARKEVALELLRLVFLCGKPHAVICFIFKQLLNYKTERFIEETLSSLVDDLADELCRSCRETIDPMMSEEYFYQYTAKAFIQKNDLKMLTIYKEKRYEPYWEQQIKEVIYAVFYTDQSPKFKQVDRWSFDLSRRVKKHVQNNEPCDDESMNLLLT